MGTREPSLRLMILLILGAILLGRSVSSPAQGLAATEPITFTQHLVSEGFAGASSVYAADLDGDGDMDILGAAQDSHAITWWENVQGEFVEHPLTQSFWGARSVHAGDLDGDGDADMLGAATYGQDIAWWDNDEGSYTQHALDSPYLNGVQSVHCADLDGDGDLDVLGAAPLQDAIHWWENQGSGAFAEHSLADDFDGASAVYAADLDGDHDVDILAAAQGAGDVAWWENQGTGSFARHTLDGHFRGACAVYAADLDGDGDVDTLGAASDANTIAWWQNDGSQAYVRRTITTDFDGARAVFATDVNGDGRVDVVAAAEGADVIAWWANQGGGSFEQRTVSNDFDGAKSVFATDLDGDGDVDLLGAAGAAGKIAWWEQTHLVSPTCLDFGATLIQLCLQIHPRAPSDSWQFLEIPSWLSLEPTSGTGQADVAARANRTGLTAGSYAGVVAAHVGAEVVSVRVRMEVSPGGSCMCVPLVLRGVPTATPTSTPTYTVTPGPSPTPTHTPTPGPSPTPTHTATVAPTHTPTQAATPGPSPTPTLTWTASPAPTPTYTATPGPSPTPTSTQTPSPTPTRGTSRVSLATSGAQANANSLEPAISSDGRYVAFSSQATNLVSGDTNAKADVFLRDRQTDETRRVSLATGGAQANGASSAPAISADGRYVAFSSQGTNLVSGDTNWGADIFIRDRQTGETIRVSVDSSGAQANDNSSSPAISGEACCVAFESEANNLVAGDDNLVADVFVHCWQTGQTTRVSVDSDGGEATGNSRHASLSGDGRYVAFTSWASDLVLTDTNSYADIFVHDRQTGETERVSVDSSGGETQDGESLWPAISADGRYTTFYSEASNLVAGDTNAMGDIFVHDRQTGQTTRVSVDSSGGEPDGESIFPAISPDGRYVAFESVASNLAADDTNSCADIFAHDRQTGQTIRVSVDSSGGEADGESGNAALSQDGNCVAFGSAATNLVAGDTNDAYDVFVHEGYLALAACPISLPEYAHSFGFCGIMSLERFTKASGKQPQNSFPPALPAVT